MKMICNINLIIVRYVCNCILFLVNVYIRSITWHLYNLNLIYFSFFKKGLFFPWLRRILKNIQRECDKTFKFYDNSVRIVLCELLIGFFLFKFELCLFLAI